MAETPKIEWPDATWIGTLTPTCPRCFGRGYTGLSSWTGHCPDCNGRGVLVPSVREIERVAKERDELRAEVERLRAALLEAAETVQEWGEYAPAYAQKKWGLTKEVERIRATATKGG